MNKKFQQHCNYRTKVLRSSYLGLVLTSAWAQQVPSEEVAARARLCSENGARRVDGDRGGGRGR